ncbi:MAG: Glycosyl transferase, family 2 [Candidatus Woesebacteria bacterium GW2011_GWA1_40_45]|uniref:Glycosyl transferase, family 2 n=2 Tax=Candidatus Woeseibacteriota TaxID=1752722 RepID=A0A0G0SE04_9BACT|nr:MAG: Glycosyl transferase, family 2 [Candidatus Woesebacteria bacterium GW2011_GWA1_40_45]
MNKQSLAKSEFCKLSIVLATRNEEENIGMCLESVKGIADEIIVVDENSTDNTREIAKKYGAKVYREPHHEIFHVTKQKAIDKATGDWILQLDADEIVTDELAVEIKEVIEMRNDEILARRPKSDNKWDLFMRHQKIVADRDGKIGEPTGEVAAFFVPRKNMFLGKPLIYAGVYPDAVIRLIKKGKAYLPAKSVHEQMAVKGEVAWLFNDLEHHDSPTLSRYVARLNRYTDLKKDELKNDKVPKNIFYLFLYSFIWPLIVFLKLFVRHKGFLDGMHGFVWSLFSALHYPIAYFKYWIGGGKK